MFLQIYFISSNFKFELDGKHKDLLYNLFAFLILNDRPLSFDTVLDAFDGSFGIVEQSIIGDLGAMYKKASPFAKWIYTTLNQRRPVWTTYRYTFSFSV